MKKSLIAGVSALALGALLGAGTFAAFSDSEVSEPQSISMGTLDLVAGGTISSAALNLANVKPGQAIDSKTFTLHNAGSLAGSGNWEVVVTEDAENGTNEAERADAADSDGELAEALQVRIDGAVNADGTPAWVSLRSLNGSDHLYNLAANGDKTVALDFQLDGGNDLQTDTVTFKITTDFTQN